MASYHYGPTLFFTEFFLYWKVPSEKELEKLGGSSKTCAYVGKKDVYRKQMWIWCRMYMD